MMASVDCGKLETIELGPDPSTSSKVSDIETRKNVPHPVLPSLRVPNTLPPLAEQTIGDSRLFSPELSRKSFENAHRRAKSLEMEILEQMQESSASGKTLQESNRCTGNSALYRFSWTSLIERFNNAIKKREIEYNLLSEGSPLSKMEIDIDSDGLQLSPQKSEDQKKPGNHKPRPVLRRVSRYTSHAMTTTSSPSESSCEKRIRWHETVIEVHEGEEDEVEDVDDDRQHLNWEKGGTKGRVKNHRLSLGKKHGSMRRLSTTEKQELYKVRPDLMITPNWAQKYREEMIQATSADWSMYLVWIVLIMIMLLVILAILIIEAH